jgi:hypothetical protein
MTLDAPLAVGDGHDRRLYRINHWRLQRVGV